LDGTRNATPHTDSTLHSQQPACLAAHQQPAQRDPLKTPWLCLLAHTPGFAGRTKVPALGLRAQHVQLQPIMRVLHACSSPVSHLDRSSHKKHGPQPLTLGGGIRRVPRNANAGHASAHPKRRHLKTAKNARTRYCNKRSQPFADTKRCRCRGTCARQTLHEPAHDLVTWADCRPSHFAWPPTAKASGQHGHGPDTSAPHSTAPASMFKCQNSIKRSRSRCLCDPARRRPRQRPCTPAACPDRCPRRRRRSQWFARVGPQGSEPRAHF